MLDAELEAELTKEVSKGLKGKKKIPFIFISAVANKNIQQLKDLLWEKLNHYDF
jgi:GTP-binding protein